MIHRRDLLQAAMTAGAASLLHAESGQSAEQPKWRFNIVDTNVTLFHWPFRRLPLDEPELLVNKLQSLGVTAAWAGSFEGLLHRDIRSVNERLAEACKKHPSLVPIGSLNLELPDWEDDFSRCVDHNMPGVRLHPNYHGYTLADPRFRMLLTRAASAKTFVQVAVAMEDTRTQHPLVQVPDVDLAPLPNLMRAGTGATIQLLNARLRGTLLEELAKIRGIYFDTARVDGTDGVAQLMRDCSPERVMFGTHAPFLIPEAALIRTYESDLQESGLRSLLGDNSQALHA